MTTNNFIRSATGSEKAKRRATIVGTVMVGLVLTAAVAITSVLIAMNPAEKKQPSEETSAPIAFGMPVEGNFLLLKEFSATDLQYNQTLNLWMSHKAVAVQAEVGTNVLAVYSGTVANVENNASYGTQITVEHANGLKTVYSGLARTVNVSKGDRVEKGQKIGTVGHTIVVEEMDPPHIRIEVYKDGRKVNPADYIDFADK